MSAAPDDAPPEDAATPGVDRRAWIRARAWLFGSALLAGVPAGALATVGLGVYLGSLGAGATKAFALGAVLLGFATLGWAGSIFAGRGVERMQAHLDTGTNWTETDSRRAMTRIAGFGLGVMLVAGVPSAV